MELVSNDDTSSGSLSFMQNDGCRNGIQLLIRAGAGGARHPGKGDERRPQAIWSESESWIRNKIRLSAILSISA